MTALVPARRHPPLRERNAWQVLSRQNLPGVALAGQDLPDVALAKDQDAGHPRNHRPRSADSAAIAADSAGCVMTDSAWGPAAGVTPLVGALRLRFWGLLGWSAPWLRDLSGLVLGDTAGRGVTGGLRCGWWGAG